MDEIIKRDENYVTVLAGVTNDSDQDVTMLRVDPITKRLLVAASGGGSSILLQTNTVDNVLQTKLNLIAGTNVTLTSDAFGGVTIDATGGGGSGTVTSVSVVTNQGVSGSVATATTTPAITLSLGSLTSITSVNGLIITADTGVITTGTWQASLITGQYGGTGVNNNGKTITLGGNFTTSGAFASTLTLTGVTNVTLPTSGTLLAGTLTTTRIPYYNGTALTDSANLVWDNTNNQLTLGSTGSATLPAISVGGTTNGMWLSGTNQLGFTTNGVNRFNLDGTSFRSVTTGGPAIARAAGAVGTPTYSYQGNVNYGDWLNGTTIARSINGVQIHATNSTGFGIFQTTPTSALHINKDQNSVTQSDANGILLANATAATVGLQSISPASIWQGNGWKTNATAGSQDVRFRADVLPIQGAANPTAVWRLSNSINGGAYNVGFQIGSNNTVNINNPANTFKYIITPAAITTADRILNLPLITGTTTIAVLGLAQTFSSPQTFSNGVTFNQLTGSLSATIGSSLLSVGGSLGIYRTTNAGADITPQIGLVPFGLVTAGTSGLFFETDASSNNALTFAMANGTRMVARAQIKIVNPTNTAGSEAGDLAFFTQTGGAVVAERLRLTGAGGITVNSTQTAGGTTGAQTINKPSGSVNFAAAATTLVVTNSLATTSSNIFVQVEGTDTTFTSARITKAAGSFTITANAAATAETRVSFWVIN